MYTLRSFRKEKLSSGQVCRSVGIPNGCFRRFFEGRRRRSPTPYTRNIHKGVNRFRESGRDTALPVCLPLSYNHFWTCFRTLSLSRLFVLFRFNFLPPLRGNLTSLPSKVCNCIFSSSLCVVSSRRLSPLERRGESKNRFYYFKFIKGCSEKECHRRTVESCHCHLFCHLPIVLRKVKIWNSTTTTVKVHHEAPSC